MRRAIIAFAIAISFSVPTAANAESAHIVWGQRDVGPRGTFNLCSFNAGPWSILAPCWASGLWG